MADSEAESTYPQLQQAQISEIRGLPATPTQPLVERERLPEMIDGEPHMPELAMGDAEIAIADRLAVVPADPAAKSDRAAQLGDPVLIPAGLNIGQAQPKFCRRTAV